ncbi:MAG: T9SS type A sorting domain-containing protein [Candidatus Methanomethylicaceae archaeon]
MSLPVMAEEFIGQPEILPNWPAPVAANRAAEITFERYNITAHFDHEGKLWGVFMDENFNFEDGFLIYDNQDGEMTWNANSEWHNFPRPFHFRARHVGSYDYRFGVCITHRDFSENNIRDVWTNYRVREYCTCRMRFAVQAPQGNDSLRLTRIARLSGVLSGNFYLQIVGTTAYVANSTTGLTIVDLSDVQHPRVVENISHNGRAQGVSISGHYAYIAADQGDLQVIDLDSHRQVGSLMFPDGFVQDVIVRDHYAYMAIQDLGIAIADVSNPTSPRRVGSLGLGGRYCMNIELDGNFAFVSEIHDIHRLVIVDISDPNNPQEVSRIDVNGDPYECRVHNGICYVAVSAIDNSCGYLLILDIRNPASPGILSRIQTPGMAWGLDLRIDGALREVILSNSTDQADGRRGIRYFDVSLPYQPNDSVGYYSDSTANCRGIAWMGNYAVVCAYPNLDIYDCSEALAVHERENPPIPSQFLLEAYPNPFNAFSTVRFDLPTGGIFDLILRDQNGRLIQRIYGSRYFDSGSHYLNLNGHTLASGIYFLELSSKGKVASKQMILLK